MRVKRHLIIIVSFCLTLISLSLILLSACSNPSLTSRISISPDINIKIGVLLPLTGPDAGLGNSFRNALELAVDMENSQINNRPVKLVIEDEGAQDPKIALEKVKKLIEYDKVGIVLGPYNNASALAVLPYTSKIPIVNLVWVEPISNKTALDNAYAFWSTPMLQDYTYPLGLYMHEKGIETVNILGTNDPVALDYIEGFKNSFTYKGGKILQEQWVSAQETDYAKYISSLKPADGFVCATLGDPAKLILFKNYASAGFFTKVPIFISEVGSLASKTMQTLGDEIIGITGVEGYLPERYNIENEKFLTEYQTRYKEKPNVLDHNAYNCMRVIIEALKITGGDTSPSTLKSALLNLEIELPTGPFRFSVGRVGIHTVHVREVVKAYGKLRWEIQQDYPLVETHQKTYP